MIKKRIIGKKLKFKFINSYFLFVNLTRLLITFLNTREFFPELYTTYQWSNQVSVIVYCLHMRMNLIDDFALKSDTLPFVAYHNYWN